MCIEQRGEAGIARAGLVYPDRHPNNEKVEGTDASERSVIRLGKFSGWTFAAALFVAAVWYALIAKRVTVADPPVFAEGEPFDRALRRFVDWKVTTFVQERIDIAIAIVAFLALVGLGLALREYLGRDRPLSVGAPVAITVGSLLWIVGNVIELGGHRALELFARTGNDLGAFDAIQFTIAEIDDWFELTGFALIGVGILAFAAEALNSDLVPRSWTFYSIVVGALFILLSAAYVANNGDLVDLLLFAGGIVIAPAWGIWTARLLPNVEHERETSSA